MNACAGNLRLTINVSRYEYYCIPGLQQRFIFHGIRETFVAILRRWTVLLEKPFFLHMIPNPIDP